MRLDVTTVEVVYAIFKDILWVCLKNSFKISITIIHYSSIKLRDCINSCKNIHNKEKLNIRIKKLKCNLSMSYTITKSLFFSFIKWSVLHLLKRNITLMLLKQYLVSIYVCYFFTHKRLDHLC